MNGLAQTLQSLAPLLISVLMLAAVFMLWRRQRSVWLMVAIVAELVGLSFRGIFFAMPGVIQGQTVFFALWTLASLAFAIGLFAYALEVTQRR